MTDDEYMKDRLNPLIEWYERKSTWDKHWYVGLKVAEGLLAAIVTLCTGFLTGPWQLRFIVAASGALLILSQGLHAFCKYHENWQSYRLTAERLKHVKYLYLTQTEPYKNPNVGVLVENVEAIIKEEHEHWIARRRSPSN